MADDFSKLIKKKSIFSKLGNTDFFNNTNANGFTPNEYEKSPSQFNGIFEDKYYFYTGLLPDVGKVGYPFFKSINIYGGEVQKSLSPLGFLAHQTLTQFITKKNELTLSPSMYDVSDFSLDAQLKSSPRFQHGGFNRLTPYTINGSMRFGQSALSSNGLYNSTVPGISFGNDVVGVYNTNAFIFDGYNTTNLHVPSYTNKTITTQVKSNTEIPYIPDERMLDAYYSLALNPNSALYIRRGSLSGSPFIYQPIGTRFGFNNQQSAINILDGMVSPYRAGIATMLDIVSTDVTRLTKFMSTTKGLSFLGKQVGMQLMNPRPETRIYNPLSIFGAIGGAIVGHHPPRHGLFGLMNNDTYSVTDDVNPREWETSNRLVLFKNKLFDNTTSQNTIPFTTLLSTGVSNAQHSIFGLQFTNPYIGKSGFDIPQQVRTPNGITNTVDSGIAQVPYKFNRHSDYTRMATDRQDFGRYSKKLQDNPNNTTLARLLSGEDYPVQYTNYNDPIKPDSGIGTSGWDITTLNFSPYDSADPTITFRAIIDTYSDAWSPSYTTINYVGNPITYPVYQNTRRTISIGFKVPIYFQSELGIVQGKLNQISSYTYPAQVKGTHRIATPYMIFKFGTFIQRVVGVISTLTYTVDSTTPWVSTTNNATEYPLVVSVALNIDVVPEGIPVAYYLKNVQYTVQNKTVVRPPIVPPKSIPYTPPTGDNGRGKKSSIDATATTTTGVLGNNAAGGMGGAYGPGATAPIKTFDPSKYGVK